MRKISKALAGGLGAAIAKTIIHFIPDMDPDTKQAIEYIIYTLLTGGIVFIAPKNEN